MDLVIGWIGFWGSFFLLFKNQQKLTKFIRQPGRMFACQTGFLKKKPSVSFLLDFSGIKTKSQLFWERQREDLENCRLAYLQVSDPFSTYDPKQ